ncbi:hypothetical protein E3N88_10604 [Mikania micrantha]|uniref:GOLD domain-containing protein n=1 Tax=Mikania micrantha TaxID=192012 RepID=A0A5N6PBB5_9ASTR|nr:hypothetical protein E3N88_10604 [Mikania micrantha]
MPANSWRSIAIFVWIISTLTQAIYFELPDSGTKCVSEHIQTNVLVLADYVLVDFHKDSHLRTEATISVKVTTPHGNTLHHQENVTYGEVPFTTTESGNYLACFWVERSHYADNNLTVSLEWRVGIAAKDWESFARKQKIEGVELKLRKLEGVVEAIHEKLIFLKNREAEMRKVSEKITTDVARFSIMSLGVCIGSSVLQVWYLKRFFHKKKLI